MVTTWLLGNLVVSEELSSQEWFVVKKVNSNEPGATGFGNCPDLQ